LEGLSRRFMININMLPEPFKEAIIYEDEKLYVKRVAPDSCV